MSIKRKFSRSILFAFLVMVATVCNAVDAPKYVYRADLRRPEVIFEHGFKAWGSNDDLIAHVTGASTKPVVDNGNKPNSAFIATSNSLVAINKLLNMFYADPANWNTTYWIYKIRTDRTYYFVPNSVLKIYKNTNWYNIWRWWLASNALQFAAHEEEWVTMRHIPVSSVVSAYPEVFYRGHHFGETGQTQYNRNYIDTGEMPIPPFIYDKGGKTDIKNIYVFPGSDFPIQADQCIGSVDDGSYQESIKRLGANKAANQPLSCASLVPMNIADFVKKAGEETASVILPAISLLLYQ